MRTIISFLLLFLLLSMVLATATEVEVLRPRFRTGADLLPAIQAAMGNEGTVTLDRRTGALVVSGTPGAIARAKKILAELDVRPRMVRIEVQRVAESDFANLGLQIDWTIAAGNWRVGRFRRTAAGARYRVYRSSDAGRMIVRVLEGNFALLLSGTRREFSPTNFSWSGFEGPEISGRLRHVQTGLLARPRIVGEEIYLDIVPQAVLFSGSDRRVRRYEQATTTIRLRDGDRVLIGAVSSQESSLVTDTLRGIEVTAGADRRVLLLEVHIENE